MPNLESIKLPIKSNGTVTKIKYDIPQGDVMESELDQLLADYAKSDDVDEALATKADKDGNYDSLIAGSAKQLLSTQYVEDSEPYNFRTSGGSKDIGDREYDEIVGGTVAWNQLMGSGSSWNVSSGGSITISDDVASFTATAQNQQVFKTIATITNHIYVGVITFKTTTATTSVYGRMFGADIPSTATTNWQTARRLFKSSGSGVSIGVRDARTESFDVIQAKEVNFFDLTQMFGSTIADYIYSLETANAGAGVSWFKKYFPKDYYEYNAGELISVKTSAHETVGFNMWDEVWENGWITSTGADRTGDDQIKSKNYIPVLPNTSYYFNVPDNCNITYYDSNKVALGQLDKNGRGNVEPATSDTCIRVTPSNCHYIRFWVYRTSTYNNDICINLSWSGWRNGEYEPYVKHTYALDSNLELRGIPKLDASNNLYYDGDVYKADGTVTRRYGIVDLGTLTWGYSSANTYFYATLPDFVVVSSSGDTPNWLQTKYNLIGARNNSDWSTADDKSIGTRQTTNYICVKDSAYSDASTFKTAMSGVYLVYELATPTEETATPYDNLQLVDDFGTEEYVDTREVAIPVGHNTKYPANLRDKLQHLPDLADSDGAYLIRQTNKKMTLDLFRIPKAPTTDGTYILKATVSSGTPTYTWVAEE